MNELEQLEEGLRLLNESLWYISWSLVFIVFAIAGEAVAFIEIVAGNIGVSLEVLGISLVPVWIGLYLRKKSREYHRKAHGEDN